MPRRTQRFVGMSVHDENTFDLNVYIYQSYPVGDPHRYSVLIPKDASKTTILESAVDLAIYVRAQHPDIDVFVKGDIHRQAGALLREAAAQRIRDEHWAANAAQRANPRPLGYRDTWRTASMEPSAEMKAELLLQQLNPDLHAKMAAGKSFYITSPAGLKYIVYPHQRALIALEPDAPKYVCIHSQDNTVERNRFDWAITMFTYIQGDETDFRKTSNFHPEYHMRGDKYAYYTTYLHSNGALGARPDPPLEHTGEPEGRDRTDSPAEEIRHSEGDTCPGEGTWN